MNSPRYPFLILVHYRLVQLRNALDQQLRDAPFRVFAVLLLLILIWAALYEILKLVLKQVGRFELVALAAKQQIFVHFFLVLAVMLAFSNAILAFTSLFGRDEAGHLLSLPSSTRQVVAVKWLEGLVLSSWAFLLLGVPLMLAVAANTDVAWYFYPLFVGHFLAFVVIPSTLGLLVAWAIAMWAPRRPLTILLSLGLLLVSVTVLYLWRLFHAAQPTEEWLRGFYGHLSMMRQPMLPTTWTSRGVFATIEGRPYVSLLYLGAVVANGAFLTWLAINLLSASWSSAYSRFGEGRSYRAFRGGTLTSALCTLLFFYLPRRLRILMLKDLRGFTRDPTQWSQMLIMFGLLLIYAANLRRLPLDLGDATMRTVVAFLNLTTVSLILATFTSRFVFPLLSLESQQLWLLGLLPVWRTEILLVKFLFSLTVTSLATVVVMKLSVDALELPAAWARAELAIAIGVCLGLSGLSVGLGARFPVFGQRNPARIASGFGGTLNLVASMLFVAAEMAGLAYLGLRRIGGDTIASEASAPPAAPVAGLLLFSAVVAGVSLWFGARHFERLDY